MRARTAGYRAFPVLGAVVALASWVSFAPADARASCASRHYMETSAAARALSEGLDLVELDLLTNERNPPAPRPCAGMRCGEKSSPPIVPATTTSRGIDSWSCHPTAAHPGRADCRGAFPERERAAHPTHVSSSIERPPRLA
jgi:hypothetical protein